MYQTKKRSIISALHASENVPDPTDNNSNIKREPAYYEQKSSFILYKFLMVCSVELLT